MRRILTWTTAGLMGLAIAVAGAEGVPKEKKTEEATCGEFGTSVHFEKTPSLAARKALEQEKLVVVLHVSGEFEDSGLT